LSEEYDPREKRLVGNFPQAFSHLSLVQTVLAAHEQMPLRDKITQNAAHPEEITTAPQVS
jgi:hypothetical protein